VFYAYSTPTKVAAVVCSGWALLGRGPQGIVAGQSGLFLLDVSSLYTSLWVFDRSVIGQNKRVYDWLE
jgi:hypothetical protein